MHRRSCFNLFLTSECFRRALRCQEGEVGCGMADRKTWKTGVSTGAAMFYLVAIRLSPIYIYICKHTWVTFFLPLKDASIFIFGLFRKKSRSIYHIFYGFWNRDF